MTRCPKRKSASNARAPWPESPQSTCRVAVECRLRQPRVVSPRLVLLCVATDSAGEVWSVFHGKYGFRSAAKGLHLARAGTGSNGDRRGVVDVERLYQAGSRRCCGRQI